MSELVEERDVAIRFEHVSKEYEGKVVVDDVSLDIGRGEFVCLIGSSGGGKTTLLKMVNGLVEPSSGNVIVDGRNVRGQDLVLLRRNIGYAIQGSVLFPHMNVEENISYVPRLWNGDDRERTRGAVRKWMAIVGLDEGLLDRYPDELSGGQQQRVGIARALAASPDILLMDEPFGAVDAITRSQLQRELRRIFDETGITVVFVTHDIGEALRLATRIAVVDGGVLQQYDEPDELVRHPATDFVRQLVASR
ncbi:ABC transporter ATP-binding protein [Olsenella sp. DNF00959]|uniref:ATP-binding cassette domain-containing protein n=1 Tax=Olsenella sp. DNF00959 TaxID=1476999 RepID=UPI000785CB26|nr:ABC transporter ATP-binding protein [Olsenella sp. DNF00959]KXB62588.1 ABC transporter, ATP-binding protein [Olsenella sp. DNF00959]